MPRPSGRGPMTMTRGAARGVVFTGKDGNKNYYKGTRSGRMGHWTRKGRYIVEPQQKRQWIVPPLDTFKLTPYVAPPVDADGKIVPEQEAKYTAERTHSVLDYFPAQPSVDEQAAFAQQGVEGELYERCRRQALRVVELAKLSASEHQERRIVMADRLWQRMVHQKLEQQVLRGPLRDHELARALPAYAKTASPN